MLGGVAKPVNDILEIAIILAESVLDRVVLIVHRVRRMGTSICQLENAHVWMIIKANIVRSTPVRVLCGVFRVLVQGSA
jgi:hypothetical protein